jgi:hypothetical protein
MTASNKRLQFNIPFRPRDFDWRPAIGRLAAKQDRSVAATARVLIRDALIRLGELPANAGTTCDPEGDARNRGTGGQDAKHQQQENS